MWICVNIWKIRLFHWFVLEIWLIKKSCNLISWEHFGPYLRNKNFHNLCRNTEYNINFHYRSSSVKINDQISQYIEKTQFLIHCGSISPIFGSKKLPQKIWLSHTTSHGIVAPCQNLEKINDTIPRKCLDRRKDGRTDGGTERQTDPIL